MSTSTTQQAHELAKDEIAALRRRIAELEADRALQDTHIETLREQVRQLSRPQGGSG